MSPLIALLIDEFNYLGTMLIIGALLFNNAVGGALYRAPPALQQVCEDRLIDKEPERAAVAAETGAEVPPNVISADYLALSRTLGVVTGGSRVRVPAAALSRNNRHTRVPLTQSSITWYRRELGRKQAHHAMHYPVVLQHKLLSGIPL